MLAKEVLQNLLWNGERCLGRAVFAARCSIIARYPTNDNFYGPAVLWTLLGDPALRVKYRALSGVDESFKLQAASRKLSVTPNPCRSSTVLHLTAGPLDHSTALVRIYDASGRLVLSQPVRSSHFTLHTSLLPAGVYLVELSSPRGTPLREKLVVR
jgi:hypothetical protein